MWFALFLVYSVSEISEESLKYSPRPCPCLGRSELQFLSLQDSASAKVPAELLSLLAAASLSVSPPLPCVRIHCSALTSALGRTGCGIPVLSSLGVSFTLESCPLIFWLCCIPVVVFSAQWDFSGLHFSFQLYFLCCKLANTPLGKKASVNRRLTPVLSPSLWDFKPSSLGCLDWFPMSSSRFFFSIQLLELFPIAGSSLVARKVHLSIRVSLKPLKLCFMFNPALKHYLAFWLRSDVIWGLPRWTSG